MRPRPETCKASLPLTVPKGRLGDRAGVPQRFADPARRQISRASLHTRSIISSAVAGALKTSPGRIRAIDRPYLRAAFHVAVDGGAGRALALIGKLGRPKLYERLAVQEAQASMRQQLPLDLSHWRCGGRDRLVTLRPPRSLKDLPLAVETPQRVVSTPRVFWQGTNDRSRS